MIELKSVSVNYGKKEILTDVSFSIKKGEVTVLIGENGAGKTTLMNTIMQLVPNYKGEITLDDKPLSKDDLNRISYIPDKLSALPEDKSHEFLEWLSIYYTSYNPERAVELLKFFNLKPNTKVKELSRGNRAKFNMVTGLCLDSDYVIMDEPFAGIDLFTREEIAEVFTSKLIEGKGVLISTHEINEIEFLVDRVILIKDKTVVLDFYPEAVREQTGMGVVDVMREVYRYGEIPKFINWWA